MTNHATVADELLFDSLPVETQDAIKRLFLRPELEYTAEDMDDCEQDAYERGYDYGFEMCRREIAAMF